MHNKKYGCKNLFVYGSGIGIIAPLLIILFYNLFACKILFPNYFIAVLVITILLAGTPLMAYMWYDTPERKEKNVDIFLYVTGFLEMISLGFLVQFTGGAINSLFTFYFLFIPSVVAISFKAKWGLVVVIATSFIAIIINVFFVFTNNVFQEIIDNKTHYKIQYSVIVLLQLILICILELKAREEKEVKNEI